MYLIVGIDPGTTSAFAALDFHKKFIATWSRREAGREALVEAIRSLGQPALIACDVSTPSELVRQIAAAFNAKIFAPSHDLGEGEKRKLAQQHKIQNVHEFDARDLGEEEKRKLVQQHKTQNIHELDALAAALKAYNAYENKLRQIGRIGSEKKLSAKIVEEAQFLVLHDVRLDVALGMLLEKPATVQTAEAKTEIRNFEKELAQGQAKIRSLLIANVELKKAVERLEAERKESLQQISSLERGAYERLRREPEMRKREMFIRRLQELIGRLKVRLKMRDEKPRPGEEKKPVKKMDIEGLVEEYRKARNI